MLADKLEDWKPGYTTCSQYRLDIVPWPVGDNPDANRPSGRGCFRVLLQTGITPTCASHAIVKPQGDAKLQGVTKQRLQTTMHEKHMAYFELLHSSGEILGGEDYGQPQDHIPLGCLDGLPLCMTLRTT